VTTIPLAPTTSWTPTEIRRLFGKATNPGFDRTALLTAFVTGGARGRTTGPPLDHLELTKEGPGKMRDPPQPIVGRRLKGEGNPPALLPDPKTKAGRRVIQIPDELVAALKRWKLQCPKSDEELVFPMPDGQAYLPRVGSCARGFYPALARARLRRVTFHSLTPQLRLSHECASGAAITEVQNSSSGIATRPITLGIYSHWFKNAKGCGAVERSRRWRSALSIRKPARVGSKWALETGQDRV